MKDLPWCPALFVIGCNGLGWGWGRSSEPVLLESNPVERMGGQGCQRIAPGGCAFLCSALYTSKPALFTSCFVFLILLPPASPCLFSSACLCISAWVPLALSSSDDSSGIGMKVTQGNKGPAVLDSRGGGEQHPGIPGPSVWLLDPQGTRHDASGSSSPSIPGCPLQLSQHPQLLLQSCGVSAASYIPALEHCGSSWRKTKGWGSIPHSFYLLG